MEYSVGIDLGTTYSCIGIKQNDEIIIVRNEFGKTTTPSYITFFEDDRIIGEFAKNKLADDPKNTIYGIKRLMGKKFDDHIVQRDILNYPFDISNGSTGSAVININIMGKIISFTPEELSAMILLQLKKDVEKYIGSSVVNAVITVPAYFNDSQRQATKDAGEIAGFNILRIINEPTAAAIAYNVLNIKDYSDKYVLVYDLGGGTLDVTILSTCGSVLTIKATCGDTHLGGDDFDNSIVEYCLMSFANNIYIKPTVTSDELAIMCVVYKIDNIKKLCQLTIEKLTEIKHDNLNIQYYVDYIINLKLTILDMKNTIHIAKLKKKCEDAKKQLSICTTTTICIDNFYKNRDLKVILTRSKFEAICEKDFIRCMEPVIGAMRDANVTPDDIHDVVLIGGSTRIIKIQEILMMMFGADKIRSNINPDEAVAYGATIQASILSGHIDNSNFDVVLKDILPLSLGVEIAGEMMDIIVKRNTQIPCTFTKIYSTYSDNQPSVTIKIFEGERKMSIDNNLLGIFELCNLRPSKKGELHIHIQFTIDENSILSVTAYDNATDNKKEITIKNNKGRLSPEYIAKKIKESKIYEVEDIEKKKILSLKSKLKSLIYSIKCHIESNCEENMSDTYTMIYNVSEWLDKNQKELAEIYENEIDKLNKYIDAHIITQSSC